MFIVGEVGCIWEISVLSATFCCEPKTALKKLRLFKILYLFIYISKGWLQKSVGHRNSQMADIWVKWPTLQGEQRETAITGPKVFTLVEQCGWLIYFWVCFPTLLWFGWPWTSSDQWNVPGNSLRHFLAKAWNCQCLDLQASLPLPWPWWKCTLGGMEELRGQSSLWCQAADLEGNFCGKPVAYTGDFAWRRNKNFCCMKPLRFSLLPKPKLVHPDCYANLQFPVQVHWGQTGTGMHSRKTRNKGRLKLLWRILIILGEFSFEGFLQSEQYLGQGYSAHFASPSFLENVFLGESREGCHPSFWKVRRCTEIDA